MNESNFLFDLRQQITEYLPVALRKSRLIAWLYTLCKPLEDLHAEFLANRRRLIREARYSSQQMLLAYMLNNAYEFDPVQQRIEVITPDTSYIRTDAFMQSEGAVMPACMQSEGDPPTEAYHTSDFLQFAFVIRIPSELVGLTSQIQAVVEKYKFVGYEYQITTI